ncbi:major sperm protein [Anaeramoeba flamelloides]|uniref:Major sperm protein n=1 Tax=Anaeramoeba flamelloides TaxID=1746091 RepID=A0ABQ8YDD4_9EUKA|nr:major sperm protein [Anaeramoeba flamelloides]
MANLVPETKHKYRSKSRSRSISKTKTKSKTKKKTHQKHKKKNKVKTNKEKKNIKNKVKENKQVNSIPLSSRKRKYLDSSNLPQNNNSTITKKEQKLEKKKDKKLEKDGKGKSKEKNRADKHNFRYKFQKIENPNEKKSKLIITRIKKKSKYVLEDGNVKKYIKNRNKARNRRNARRFRQRKKNIVQDLETEAKMLKLKKINLLGNIDDVDQENLILQRQIQLLMEDLSQSSNSDEEPNETGETTKIKITNNNTCSELSYLLPLFDSNKFENKQSQELEKTEIPQFFFDDLIEDNNFNFEDEEQF